MNIWETLLSVSFTLALISIFTYITLKLGISIHALLKDYTFEVSVKLEQLRAKRKASEEIKTNYRKENSA